MLNLSSGNIAEPAATQLPRIKVYQTLIVIWRVLPGYCDCASVYLRLLHCLALPSQTSDYIPYICTKPLHSLHAFFTVKPCLK